MDPRIERVAKVLVNYSVAVQPGEWVIIRGDPIADPMIRAVYNEVLAADGRPQLWMDPSWLDYTYLSRANDEQLAWVSPATRMLYEQATVLISFWAETNTKALTNIDPERRKQRNRATASLTQTYFSRLAEGSMRWVGTLFPTQASAQDAEMSLEEYEDFVYGAGLVNDDNAIQRWQEVSQRQQRLVDWLKGRQQVHIKGANVNLRLSIQDRTFMNAAGKQNFPDGEIYTSPVEDSAEGWVRFTYPAVLRGREVTGIELTFEKGKVVKASATKNEDALLSLLETDHGSSYLGELGIGTNAGITRFTSNTLFDEKIQGTFHLALGAGFGEAGGENQSAIHEDIVCDLKDGEIIVDGDTFFRHGDFVI